MQKLRRWAAAALCGAAFASSAAAVLAACAVCPGRAWIVRGALFLQDPAAAAAIAWPADAARAAYKPQKPDRRPTPVPTATPSPAPTTAATPTPEPSPTSTPLPSAAPELDDAGRIRSVTLRQGSGDGYVELAAGSIRNSTEHTDADLRAAVTTQNLPFVVEKNSALPQVLIMHTHATESYQTWPDPVFDPGYTARSKSTALNMCAVGEKMAQVLNAAGIRTLHDETLYDAPGYTDSYKRSRAGVQAYLERYPSIKVVLDVHRDAIEDIQTIQAELDAQKTELEAQKANLEKLKDQQTAQMQDMQAKQQEVQTVLNGLSDDVKELMAQRDSEILAAAQAEEAARKAAAAAAANKNNSYSGGSSSGGGSYAPGTPQQNAGSGKQQAVVNACYSTPSPGQNWCAAWVTNVFRNAGVGYFGGNACDMFNAWCYSSDRSALQVGMIVADSSHSGTGAPGLIYGHVGIYVGGGIVMSNEGAITSKSLDSFISFYGTGSGVRWGWLGGVVLS